MRKVFGIGLSKTGTTSLSAALAILGYRSKHFPKDEDFARYDAFSDITVAMKFKTLDRFFPGSQFIYTVTRSRLARVLAVLMSKRMQVHTAGTQAQFGPAYLYCKLLSCSALRSGGMGIRTPGLLIANDNRPFWKELARAGKGWNDLLWTRMNTGDKWEMDGKDRHWFFSPGRPSGGPKGGTGGTTGETICTLFA
jgi:hypothetical protein